MNRTLRLTPSRITSSLLLCAALSATALAGAAPPPPPTAVEQVTLESKLAGVLGRPGGLTSEAVGTRAEATSFEAAARREDLAAAVAAVDQALVAYFPKVTVTGRYTRLSPIDPPALGPSNFVVTTPGVAPYTTPLTDSQLVAAPPLSFPVILDNFLLQGTVNVPLSDYLLRIPQSYAAATQNQKAAALSEKAARKKNAADAKVAYYTWVRAKLQEIVDEQALAQARAHLVDAQHAFDAGTASRADVLSSESRVAQSQLLVEQTANLRIVSEAQVRVVMHDRAVTPYEIGEAIDTAIPAQRNSDNLAAMLTEAKSTRLEIRAFDESARSLGEQARVARAGHVPRIDGFADLIYANPNPRIFPAQGTFRTTWDVGVQLTWSPNDIGLSAASSASLEARAASLVAQRQVMEDGIELEVTRARNALREALLALDTTARGLAAAEESYRVRRSLFQNGRATNVELTDAETDLTRSRLLSINEIGRAHV